MNFIFDNINFENRAEILDFLSICDTHGIFIAPSENIDEFIERVKKVGVELKNIENSSSDFSHLYKNCSAIPETEKLKAQYLTEDIYNFRADWLVCYYSNKQAGKISAGVQLEIDDFFSLIFLRENFKTRESYFTYFADEVLAHEMVHAARISFPISIYEEYFPSLVYSSKSRQLINNFFRKAIIPISFLLSSQLAIVFYKSLSFLWVIPIAIIMREITIRKRIKKAGKKLEELNLSKSLLLRLSDEEIYLLAKGDFDIEKLKLTSLRFEMLFSKFKN